MIRLLEDLCDIGEKAAWEAVQALYSYYTMGTFPVDICGEAKLLVIGVIERTRKGGW